MTGIPEKVVALHHSLDDADVPHAFGGALALAWWAADLRRPGQTGGDKPLL